MGNKDQESMSFDKASQFGKINDKIILLQDELHPVAFNKKTLERKLGPIEIRMNELRGALAANGTRAVPFYLANVDKKDIVVLEDELAQVKSDLDSTTRRHDKLVSEIDSLTQELAEFGFITSEDIICWQKEATIVAERIEHIKQAIEKQREMISKANSDAKMGPGLLAERERLLAEIAMGEADQVELKKIDNKIEKHEKEQMAKLRDIIRPAEQTIVGLQAKLTASENLLDIMKQQGGTLLTAYLSGVAESLGNDYAALTSQLAQCFSQLIALSRLLEKTKGKYIRSHRWSDLHIPAFALKACNGRHTPAAGGLLFNAEIDGDNYSAVMKAEVDHILSLAPDLGFAIK